MPTLREKIAFLLQRPASKRRLGKDFIVRMEKRINMMCVRNAEVFSECVPFIK